MPVNAIPTPTGTSWAGKGWLPPALVIAEPPVEVAQERPVFDNEDDGDEDGEAVEFEEEEAA